MANPESNNTPRDSIQVYKEEPTPSSIGILWPTGMGKHDIHQLFGRVPRKPLNPSPTDSQHRTE